MVDALYVYVFRATPTRLNGSFEWEEPIDDICELHGVLAVAAVGR